jgi:hypothetical protein
MIAARMIQRIEGNWERIAATVIAARDSDPDLPHYRDLSNTEIRDRVRDLSTNLAQWLISRDEAILGYHFEQLGRRRFAEGMPLPELILKITTIKRAIRSFATEQNLSLTPIEIYEELELLRAMAGYWDFVIYRVTRGYEEARAALERSRVA